MTENDETAVVEVLAGSESPLTHEEVAERAGMDVGQAAETLGDLVITNQARANADWEYRLLGGVGDE